MKCHFWQKFLIAGMRSHNFFWVLGEPRDNKQCCHLLFYLLIACTLAFLLLQLMPHQVVVHLLSTTILGTEIYLPFYICFFFSWWAFGHSWNLHRTSPSPFVIPVARYNKATYMQPSVGMRFAMMFETEESSKRRFVHFLFSFYIAFVFCFRFYLYAIYLCPQTRPWCTTV